MWSKIDNPPIDNNRVIIDYRKEKNWGETKTYGKNIDIREEIRRVENIYKENFDDFDCRWPNKDELIVVNVENSVDRFRIIRKNGEKHDYFGQGICAEAMIDPIDDKII